MIFIRLIRFILGYVRFSAKGGFPERFINLCTNKGISLWDLQRIGNELHASTNIKSYKMLRGPAKKSGMLPRISKKVGLPFFLHRYRRRVGLLIGFALALIIMSVLSSMIWTVEINGNEKIKTEVLISALEDAGVKKSVFRRSINQTETEQLILERFSDINWVSLNILGSKASLEVRERISPPDMFDYNQPCNIVALHDGEITRIEVSSGRAMVSVGSAVLKGDLLVSGVLDSQLFTQYVHAKANVFALTNKKIETRVEKLFKASFVKDDKIRYSIYFYGLKLPLGLRPKEYDEHIKSESFIMAADTVLPIGIIRERFGFFEDYEYTLSGKRASLIVFEKFYGKYKSAFAESDIISSDISLNNENDVLKLVGTYKAEESIGTEKPFEVENEDE